MGDAIASSRSLGGMSPDSGSLSGTLSAAGGLSGSISVKGGLSGALSVPKSGGGGSTYVLPPATRSELGGVIVGDDLMVTEEGRISVDKATSVEEDNTRPISAAAVYTEIGNINALLATI